jgi:hypothetical protein
VRITLAAAIAALLLTLCLAVGPQSAQAVPGKSCGSITLGGKSVPLRAGLMGCGKAAKLAKKTSANNTAPKGFKCNGNLRNNAICFDKTDADRFYQYGKYGKS